jgi:hypothetical protein
MIRSTRWSPDTCACVIEFQWDDSLSEATRTHSAGTTINQCSLHAGLSVAAHFTALTDENPRKNKILDRIITAFPPLTVDDISWAFDTNRVLNVTIGKLTSAQKATLQTAANNQFGAGKVLVL